MRCLWTLLLECVLRASQAVQSIKTRYTRATRILRLFATITIFVIIISILDLRTFFELLSSTTWQILALAFGLTIFVPIIAAWRWFFSCRFFTSKLGLGSHLELHFVSMFLGQALSSSLGSEAIRLMLYKKHCGSFLFAVFGSITDRFLGFVSLALIFLITLPIHNLVMIDGQGRALIAWVTLLVCSLITIVCCLSIFIWINGFKVLKNKRLTKTAKFFESVFEKPWLVLGTISIGVLLHCTSFASVSLIFLALGTPITIWDQIVMLPVIFLVMIFPVLISGWGFREGVFVLFFGFVGVPIEASFAVSILFGLAMAGVSLIGGIFMIRGNSMTDTA